MQDESQELETTESQAEAAEGQAEDSAIIEQVGQLLGNQDGTNEQSQEEEPVAKVEEPKVEEAKVEAPVETPVLTIDETMVAKYPRLKMYLGKNLTEDLPRAYDNIVQAYLKDHQELINIKKERAKKSIPDPSEVPDPVEKPEEFKKYLAGLIEAKQKEAVEEYLSKPREPQVDWVAEARKIVPENVDFEAFRQDFMMFNAERFYNELGEVRPEVESFYNANPQILISEMKKHYELTSKAQKSKEMIAKESNDKAYKTISTSLKKAQENKEDLQGAQFNAVNRTETTTPEEEILAKIYQIAQGQ